ncbi:guanine deaminase [Roseivivax sp.]
MTQTDQIIRGRLLSFHRAPMGPEDHAAFTYLEDGALRLSDGRIAACGDWDQVRAEAPALPVVDHRPHLILPGFIDTHIHFPQIEMIASWGAQLLDWLNGYTFPAELRYADPDHAAAMASEFYDLILSHGTTTAVAFCSVHPASAEAYFAEAERRGMRMLGGKVMMDRNAPEGLRDTAQSGYDESRALIERWDGRGRAGYVISPRFALTSTPEQLEAAGALAAEHPGCPIQTHLSENLDEIAATRALFPEAPDYLGVYEAHGLVRQNTLLGHAIHLEPREIDLLAERGATPVFCPTSNLFLGSGLFDDSGLRARGITPGVATDVGAGTSYSMLTTLAEAYKVLQLRGQKLHPLAAFDWITRGNAEVLGLSERIGTLAPGTEADLVVLDSRATPALALRSARATSLSEELFALQILGDDRAVAEVYVAGAAQKGGVARGQGTDTEGPAARDPALVP